MFSSSALLGVFGAADDVPTPRPAPNVRSAAVAVAQASAFSHTRGRMKSSQETTDEELMAAYRDGNAAAFETLYTRHKGGLFRYFRRQCRSASEAEELFQDVWTNVIRARVRYAVEAKFTTYLYRIAHNRLIDHYRRAASGVPLSYDDDPEVVESMPAAAGDQPEARYLARVQVERFQALLGDLPEAQREAFLLHEDGGMSVDAIAEATGVNRETAKSRLRYAVNRLRRGMQELL